MIADASTNGDDGDARLAAMWRDFIDACRHRRAPAALRDRVIAALRAAAADREPEGGDGHA